LLEFFLAVDGGGSKTEFCLYNRVTGETQCFLSGSTNYKITAVDAEREAFREGVSKVFLETGASPGQIRGLVMGMAGIDSPSDHAHYLQIGLATGVPKERIYLCNDSELAFYSAGRPPGLCVIAGTGSACTGVAADRRTTRSGGWGSPISDEGSGGWIGIRILSELLRYCDGYGTYRPVYESLRERFGAVSFEDLPKILSLIGMREIAGAARPVLDGADAGDGHCGALVRKAALLAAEMAYSVYAKLDFEREHAVDIVLAGSLFKSTAYRDGFEEATSRLIPKGNFHFRREVSSPVLGGIELAKTLFA